MFFNSKEFSEFFVCLCCSIFKELLAFALVSVSLVIISLSNSLVNTFFQTFFKFFHPVFYSVFKWLLSATLTVYHFLNFLSIPFQNFFSLFCSVSFIRFFSPCLADSFVILSQHRPQVKHFFHLFSAFFMLLFFA